LNGLKIITILFLMAVHLAACTGSGDTEQQEQIITGHKNRLANSLSPYLLQHANNPVDWFPWGDEAFEKSRKANKPIFLSIGYSACHWCHVMAHESFENEEVAAFLNEHFVSIKVDREEHPEIDEIYMNAVQMMTGSGGWPLTVFLTMDLKPFYGGTYFPPEPRYGRPGFMQLLQQISTIYRDQRNKVDATTAQIMQGLQNLTDPRHQPGDYNPDVIETAFRQVGESFDAAWGGFGAAPKFPPTGQMDILLRNHHRTGSVEPLKMVEHTLTRMAQGGIYDQLGGGFHRYSVDTEWLTPHFEKMLYDNALLAISYMDCYLVTGNEYYADIARQILDWVIRDMSDPAGGFHSSWDADSEGEEGVFYVWDYEDVKQILGEDDFAIFSRVYGLSSSGNFEGANILHLPQAASKMLKTLGAYEEDWQDRLDVMKSKLLNVRNERIHPHLDDKVLSDWNGLMIMALARGYRALGDKRYLDAATKTADFFMNKMWRNDHLLHSYRAGNSDIDGMLDDYAFQMAGLVELYQAGFERKYLDEAIHIAQRMYDLFWDAKRGGYFMTVSGRTDLIDRTKSGRDGAIPSGNGFAASALLALYQLTDRDDFREQAEGTVRAFVPMIERYPTGHLRMISAIEDLTTPIAQVAIVGRKDDPETIAMLKVVNGEFLPGVVLAWSGSENSDVLALFAERDAIDGRPTAYYCHNFTCKAPVFTSVELKKLIDNDG